MIQVKIIKQKLVQKKRKKIKKADNSKINILILQIVNFIAKKLTIKIILIIINNQNLDC